MTDDPAAMLRILFAIPQAQIGRDVAEGEKDFKKLVEQCHARHLKDRKNKDPEVAARRHHREMVRTKVLRSQEHISEEMRFCFVSLAANEIADEAVSVAHEQGRLAELGRRMTEIQEREGLQDDEFWPIGEGPDDYQEASRESEKLYDGVYDSVFTTMLRRYGLGDIANLYETDRERYDEITERGRKAIFEGAPKK